MPTSKKRAVFFDRDGVIFRVVVRGGKPTPPYTLAEFKEKGGLMPGARGAVEAAKALGFLAILVTNQPDIRYGNTTKEDFDAMQAVAAALSFDDIFICFHGRDDECDCRKPKPGMIFDAARKWNIDLAQSFLVGDTESDLGAAKAAGCKSILVRAPYNTLSRGDYGIADLSHTEDFMRILTRQQGNGTMRQVKAE